MNNRIGVALLCCALEGKLFASAAIPGDPLTNEVDVALREMNAGTLAARRMGERFDHR